MGGCYQKSCPCSSSRRLSCDRVTHRRALTKFIELSPRVAVITWRCSHLWQSMMLQSIEAVREHQLGPSVDTRTCGQSTEAQGFFHFFRREGVLACRTSLGARQVINAHPSVQGVYAALHGFLRESDSEVDGSCLDVLHPVFYAKVSLGSCVGSPHTQLVERFLRVSREVLIAGCSCRFHNSTTNGLSIEWVDEFVTLRNSLRNMIQQ